MGRTVLAAGTGTVIFSKTKLEGLLLCRIKGDILSSTFFAVE